MRPAKPYLACKNGQAGTNQQTVVLLPSHLKRNMDTSKVQRR